MRTEIHALKHCGKNIYFIGGSINTMKKNAEILTTDQQRNWSGSKYRQK